MAKYFGKIGFALTVDKGHGVFAPEVIEKDYYGDIKRRSLKMVNGTGTNDDLTISNEISIICDEFLTSNFQHIAYITIYGAKWKISSVEIGYPRLTLSTGGLYNE